MQRTRLFITATLVATGTVLGLTSCSQPDVGKASGDLSLVTVAGEFSDEPSVATLPLEGTFVAVHGCGGITTSQGTRAAVLYSDAPSERDSRSGTVGIRLSPDQIVQIGQSYSGGQAAMELDYLKQQPNGQKCAKVLGAIEGALIYEAGAQLPRGHSLGFAQRRDRVMNRSL